MILRRCAARLLLIGLFVTPITSRADDTRAIEVAKKSYDDGVAQYKKNDVEGARLSFAQSFAAWPAVETLRSLAIAELDTGRFLDALKHFKMYTKDKAADAEFLKKVPGFIERCNEHVGHIRIVAPAGASLLVDGHRVFDLREPLDVNPGSHTVVMREPGPPQTRTETVAVTTTVDVIFTSEPPSSLVASTSSSNAGATGASAQPPDIGPSSKEPAWISSPFVPIALGVLAAGLAAGGGISLASASNNDSRAAEIRTQFRITRSSCVGASTNFCSDLGEAIDSKIANENRAVGLFVGAAVAAGGVVAWFVWGRESQSTKTAVVPVLGPGAAGASLSGRF